MTLMDGVSVVYGRAVLGEGHTLDLGLSRENVAKLTSDKLIIGVRPENWEIVAVNEDTPAKVATVPLEVALVEHLGVEQYAYCTPVMSPDSPVEVRGERVTVRAGQNSVKQGDRIHVRPTLGGVVFFDPETEINLDYL